jgi:hypothetical protein
MYMSYCLCAHWELIAQLSAGATAHSHSPTTWLQEIEDQALQAQRMAEGERKKLEDDVLIIIRDFNLQLQQLYRSKLRAQMALCVVEQQQLALAKALAQEDDDDIVTAVSAAAHEALPERLKAMTGIVGELKGQSEKQLGEYATVMHVSKALERGLQKSFPRLELQMPLIFSIFRCSPALQGPAHFSGSFVIVLLCLNLHMHAHIQSFTLQMCIRGVQMPLTIPHHQCGGQRWPTGSCL